MIHPGKFFIVLLVLILYGLCTPYGADHLLAQFEHTPPFSSQVHADALVILGGGRWRNAPEYGGDTLSGMSLERVRYGAKLWRIHRLPIVVSGGNPHGGTPEAVIMKTVLNEELNVPVTWVEPRSDTTFENARNCRALLPASIHTIILVTHAWHIPRAQYAFEQAGFAVIPAGTGYALTRPPRWTDFLPHFSAVRDLGLVVHEGLGWVWYHLRTDFSVRLPLLFQ